MCTHVDPTIWNIRVASSGYVLFGDNGPPPGTKTPARGRGSWKW